MLNFENDEDLMLYFAKKIEKYCTNCGYCENCIFKKDGDSGYYECKINEPNSWKLE